MGSVTPLLALSEEIRIKDPETEFLWIGTRNGPEKKIVSGEGIKFVAIPAGKLRRYFSGKNLFTPFLVLAGFLKSFFVILKFKPQIILSAGGFVGVPVIFGGWILKVPSLVHQQDIRPGFANRLTSRFAKTVTVAFPESEKFFSKSVWTGNPVRRRIFSGNKERAIKFFGLEKDLPTIFILGGGTGALELNNIVLAAVPELIKFCQVIHITGGRFDERMMAEQKNNERYHPFDFLESPLRDAYIVADLVVSRAGLGTLTELAALGKPTILVPMPKSHQEDNAWYFKKNNAVEILDQEKLMSANFAASIKELLNDKARLDNLSRNIGNVMKLGAAGNMVEEIFKIIKK